jgi:lysophospholipase L1-like esterase
MKKLLSLILTLLISFSAISANKKHIKPNNESISIKGAFFLDKSDDVVIINRISPTILNKKETYMRASNANTQSGVRISITTDSKEVSFLFEKREDAAIRHSIVGIFKNGELIKEIKLIPDKPLTPFTVSASNENEWAEWTVVLPPYYGMNFKGIDIDENSSYKSTTSKDKPVYVAIGNSITQGTGQKSGYSTYPYLVAEYKGWELYNVAVGGSKISWTVAEMLKNEHIDYITILWGYNDWNAGFSPNGEIIPRYTKLLKLLIKYHPEAKIYCILPTVTKATSPKKGNYTLDDIRNAEKEVAEVFVKKDNKNIIIIDGQKISDISFLNDKVHFSTEGADKFASNLVKHLE